LYWLAASETRGRSSMFENIMTPFNYPPFSFFLSEPLRLCG